jgi:hypothetical protein
MIAFAMRSAARVRVLAAGIVLAGVLGAPPTARAQLFFSETPAAELRVAPLTVRAAVTPKEGPVAVRVQFSVTAPAGATVPDLYLLWPGEVTNDPTLGARDPALAEQVTALHYDVIDEGRLVLRARRLSGEGPNQGREPLKGGAPYVTFVQTGGTQGLSAPATWIRIPAWPRLTDPEWIVTLEIPSLSAVKAKRSTFFEHWVLGDRQLFALTFNEVRGRPLRRMYLAHRDRVVHLGDAPAEMTVTFAESDHLRIDMVSPPTAVRTTSETAESTEVVSLFLDTGEGATPQRLSVQYGYYSRTQAIAVVVVPLALLVLGYAVGPLIGRAAVHFAERLAGRIHVSGWNGVPRERKTGVVLSRDTLAKIRPGVTTYEDVLRLCGPIAEEGEHFPTGEREQRTLVYRGGRVRPRTRRLFGWLSSVRNLEVERHEVTIQFTEGIVRDVQADIKRSVLPVGERPPASPA